ncbi:PilN domain-containing protein [Neptunomonas japonica]|uniref:MSHA biogenesis protein MshI n=1 Tax=Neptunomonas japonica JAMM 1380 TaxID=1441457 RepID=A0A7R6PD22_9GAMM|nr:PilN domain-containing protein [Neptunomonas japonica]BBB31518.1 MSHA biogenesis protein MshI [Neptunomonas japonica JAMM 1380]
MKQRINLLPPKPKVERDLLCFSSVLMGLAGVLMVCSVITGLLWYDTEQTEEKLNGLVQQEKSHQSKLQDLESLRSQRTPDPELMGYRDLLKQTVLSKKRLSNLLQTVQPEHRQGFSEGLLAFSNSTPDKVWLTAFKMTSGSLILDLTGESSDTSKIPLFLRSLAQQEFFKSMRFAELETERKNDQAYIFNAHGVITGSTYD